MLRKGRANIVLTYMASTYMKWKAYVQTLVTKPPDLPTQGITLVMAAVVKRPKKTERDYPKGDVDNYSKSLMDALNKWLYCDDDQVRTLVVTKEYGHDNEVRFVIRDWDQQRDSADAVFKLWG